MDGFFLHLLVKALQLKEPVFFLPPPVCKTQPRNCQWSFFFLHFCCVLLSLVSLSILTIGPKAAHKECTPQKIFWRMDRVSVSSCQEHHAVCLWSPWLALPLSLADGPALAVVGEQGEEPNTIIQLGHFDSLLSI